MTGKWTRRGALALGLAAMAIAPASAKVEGDTVYLGAAISLTGKYSTNGEHTQRGYDLAVQMINDAGGIEVDGQSYKLGIIYYDDESTPARGAQLAERLINQDGVEFMLGPYSSGLTKAIAPVTEQYGVPMVEANGASLSLFNQGYEYLFAVLSTTEQYLASAVALSAEIAIAEGRDPSTLTMAAAFENDPFSQDIRTGVLADAEALGITVVIDDQLPPELNDMAATLAKVKALQPDILLVSGHAKGATLAVRQMEEMRVDVPLLAMTHCDSADIIGNFGDAAEYILCASQWAPSLSYSDDLFGSAADFAATFEAEYGYAPPYQAAESAAAVMVFADAFERAGSFDRVAVRDALAATDMQTFYGNILFDETGKNTAKPMVLYQVQDGEYVVVAPTAWAAAEVRWPIPPWADR
ncbi:MAG: amino acid ABC transporter substrate-binding protein [Alphaproteobacteria bacterium]|jgi:branched-chain amino acid transport system substrate-binding protein|nr:amino acid ABC transporter substrate-binding protein [Rhodospirillaceae bacterium]MDG2482521.1 amino acid ABC transporter substrate-binding protein [Alphaproteobacteria bacterium]MBT6203678.1 amino acid ABC transporter substrate-binding protein [Rhodospirillaceae bacterium]MBT6511779.1 amino acid ABC transporter substrate-binding protein [Rhodospirillaceae bacterium]MBT7612016.1 amino acid ABC transporter substrate-binding protein [Rhodospirillaceae bacterium]